MQIAVFGSAFNPPTFGHQDAINSILAHQPSFDQVLLVPSYQHAFGKHMLPYVHRVELLNRFAATLGNDCVKVCAIETEIAKDDKPVYTFDVLNYLQTQYYPDAQLTFVVGPDNVDNWHKFYRAEEILQRWQRLVVPQRKDIRSTYVRDAIVAGENVEKWVPKIVLDYIFEHRLYG
jgi:nicotinate-nucleotide adenylyltransferase